MPELRKEQLQPLVEHLKRMIAAQEKLLETLSRKREAIRTADGPALAAAAEVEGALAGRMVTLEQQRRHVVQQVLKQARVGELRPSASAQEIAAQAAAGQAEELLDTARTLRGLVERAAQENSVIREAGDHLLGHMRHLSTLMHGALDRAKTYSRAGRMHVTPQLTTTVDISS
jgi:hypothetical protein